jgi:hypothetical protein
MRVTSFHLANVKLVFSRAAVAGVGVLPCGCGREMGAVVYGQDTLVEFRAQWHIGTHRAATDLGIVYVAAQETTPIWQVLMSRQIIDI